jgi:hypothetical protein
VARTTPIRAQQALSLCSQAVFRSCSPPQWRVERFASPRSLAAHGSGPSTTQRSGTASNQEVARRGLAVRYLLGQDSGDAEHVSGHADSARHSFHGITLKAGSLHDLGIRRLVEPDHPDENLLAIRQMPGGSGVL